MIWALCVHQKTDAQSHGQQQYSGKLLFARMDIFSFSDQFSDRSLFGKSQKISSFRPIWHQQQFNCALRCCRVIGWLDVIPLTCSWTGVLRKSVGWAHLCVGCLIVSLYAQLYEEAEMSNSVMEAFSSIISVQSAFCLSHFLKLISFQLFHSQ